MVINQANKSDVEFETFIMFLKIYFTIDPPQVIWDQSGTIFCKGWILQMTP